MKNNKLNFSAFELKYKGETTIKVEKNGNIFISGNLLGRITKDGKLNDKNEKVLVKMTNDNILKDAKGNTIVKIHKDGTIDNGSGEYIKWTEKGKLMKERKNLEITIHPIDNNSLQVASILIFLHLIFDEQK